VLDRLSLFVGWYLSWGPERIARKECRAKGAKRHRKESGVQDPCVDSMRKESAVANGQQTRGIDEETSLAQNEPGADMLGLNG